MSLPLDDRDVEMTLRTIAELLLAHNETLTKYGLPIPPSAPLSTNPINREHFNYDPVALATRVVLNEGKLNPEQRVVYDEVCVAINAVMGIYAPVGPAMNRSFFLDGIGGSGKTFTYSLLLDYCRSKQRVALAVASSGIAALLLEGGTTGHSRFSVPIQCGKDSMCNTSVQSPKAEAIRQAVLIIWDEAPMMNKHVYEALNRTCQDIMAVGNPAAR